MTRTLLVVLFAFIGCGDSASVPAPATAPAAQNAAVNAVTSSPKVVEALKTADAADGTEDKVAHRCAGCALAMDGEEKHTINVDGYALHMCSAMCKSHFEKDLSGNLTKLLD